MAYLDYTYLAIFEQFNIKHYFLFDKLPHSGIDLLQLLGLPLFPLVNEFPAARYLINLAELSGREASCLFSTLKSQHSYTGSCNPPLIILILLIEV